MTFTRDPASGALNFAGATFEPNSGPGHGLARASQVSLSPNDKDLYVAAEGEQGIGVFSLSASTCQPTFLQLVQDFSFLGRPILNNQAGTATIIANVPSLPSIPVRFGAKPIGTLLLFGKGLQRQRKRPRFPGSVALLVATKGVKRRQLTKHHKVTVKANVTYTAVGGSRIRESVVIKLIKRR